MKKISSVHNDRDLILCTAVPGKLQFSYQPLHATKSYYLFDCDMNKEVLAYFRSVGTNISPHSFALTIEELYRFRDYHNRKLAHLIPRIPGHVDYVIREYIGTPSVRSPRMSRSLTGSRRHHITSEPEMAA